MAVLVTIHPELEATSYVDLTYFQAWCAQNLKDLTGQSTDAKSVAVNAAAEYMDARYLRLPGYRKLAGQLREYPRESAWDSRGDKITGVPKAWKDACCAFAFLSLGGVVLMPNQIGDEQGRALKMSREKVGPIETEVEYDNFGGYVLPIFPQIDRQLYRLGLAFGSGSGISTGSVGRA